MTSDFERRRRMLRVKRAIDVVVSTIMILLLGPVFLVIIGMILVCEGRPVFYRQTRVGRSGELFTMMKFRTMVTDAHERRHELALCNERIGPLFKMADDPRVTKIGAFLRRSSLDELPQLFNVWLGTMSLVGPRPCLPEERETFSEELLARELMPQGMTGQWQLDARHESDFDRYEQLDLEYVRDWTLGRDLSILLRTPLVVIRQALAKPPPEVDLTEAAEPPDPTSAELVVGLGLIVENRPRRAERVVLAPTTDAVATQR